MTAITFNDTAEQIISGGIDDDIKVWDLRKNAQLYKMRGHTDTVTGITLSPDGSYVLSNSMDNTGKLYISSNINKYGIIAYENIMILKITSPHLGH